VRQRVVSIADELRYTPHHAARSLSSRRTNTVGVVLPDLHGEFFSELMRGIDGVARERGLHLLVSSYHGRPEEQIAALGAMRGRVDGLLVMSPSVSNAGYLGEHLLSSLPSVLINPHVTALGARSLSVDNHGGAQTMVRHLIACGYRRIAFIAGPEDNFEAHERQRGYLDALGEAGLASRAWVIPGEFDEASGHRAGLQLVASPHRPDAVFAANDMMALGCLFALNQSGVRVPDEIALAGFDDIPLARYVHPALTTMRVDIPELGALALQMLLDIDVADACHSLLLPAELIVRASTMVRPQR